jgi:hypothetical protein
MPKNGNSAEKRAARRVQQTLTLPYTQALRLVQEKKNPTLTWDQTADAVLTEQAGPGFEEAAQ